jgi:hypothetical protein
MYNLYETVIFWFNIKRNNINSNVKYPKKLNHLQTKYQVQNIDHKQIYYKIFEFKLN